MRYVPLEQIIAQGRISAEWPFLSTSNPTGCDLRISRGSGEFSDNLNAGTDERYFYLGSYQLRD
jgi:hypothetical protein